MPLLPYQCDLFARLTAAHGLGGRIGCLGRVTPSRLTVAQTRDILRRHGWDAGRTAALGADGARLVEDRELFRALGYREALAVDFDPSEGAEVIMDLNQVGPPAGREGSFDVIYDNGTLEHVFHVPNALENIFLLLAEGGVIIHSVPTNGQVDHGFYQLSPSLFLDYHAENGYEILACDLVRHAFSRDRHAWHSWPFDGRGLSPDVLYGRLGGAPHDLVFVARKTARTTGNRMPTQFRYRQDRPVLPPVPEAVCPSPTAEEAFFERSIQLAAAFLEGLAPWERAAIYGCGARSERLVQGHRAALERAGAVFLESTVPTSDTFLGFPRREASRLREDPPAWVLLLSGRFEAEMLLQLQALGLLAEPRGDHDEVPGTRAITVAGMHEYLGAPFAAELEAIGSQRGGRPS